MLPKAINYKGKIMNTIGKIEMYQGAFLVTKGGEQLMYFDFSFIPALSDRKKSTMSENVLAKFIVDYMQQKVENGFSEENLKLAIANINGYINNNEKLFKTMEQMDNNGMIKDNISLVLSYYEGIMQNNQYFRLDTEEAIRENFDKSLPSNLPEYNESVVTSVIKEADSMFDVNGFIYKYFNNFTVEQIDLILKKFKLKDQQVKILKERREFVKPLKSSEIAKTKRLSLFGKADEEKDKKSAFIDSILLAFIVGSSCGAYLLYLILTIMS